MKANKNVIQSSLSNTSVLFENDYEDLDDCDDANQVIEESPYGRWNKLETEIFIQKLLDFDSAHLGIDTEKGVEIAWNEMKYTKNPKVFNRFQDAQTLKSIYEKLECILEFLLKLDHSNVLKFYDYWFVDNEIEAKLVVITEYSSAGSLRKALEKSRITHSKVKPHSCKRWLNQILCSIKYLHSENVSIFQGYINTETIFIQNSGVIKLTPILLALNTICEISNNVIKCSNSNTNNNNTNNNSSKPSVDSLIKLNNEIKEKDFNAFGRLALEIFNTHLIQKNASSPRTPKSRRTGFQFFDALFDPLLILPQENFIGEETGFLNNVYTENELENDFILKCFNPNSQMDDLWYHPYLNNIYSLKVLSVFSILTFFHENKLKSIKSHNPSTDNESKSTFVNNNSNENNGNNLIESINSTENNSNSIFMENNKNDSENLFQNKKIEESNSFHLTNNYFTPMNNDSILNLRRISSLRTANLNHQQKDRRKVSLTFLTNYNNLTIPQNFFSILEDIRFGLYPRLFKDSDYKDLTTSANNLRSISSSSCLEFVIQQKQIIDRRSSNSNANNNFEAEKKFYQSKFLPLIESDMNDELFYENNDIDLKEKISNGLLIETRRLASEFCTLNINQKTNMIELCLELDFDDKLHRKLECYFPIDFLKYFQVNLQENKTDNDLKNDMDILNSYLFDEHPLDSKLENVCIQLANELCDFGLINQSDHSLILELMLNTIKEILI